MKVEIYVNKGELKKEDGKPISVRAKGIVTPARNVRIHGPSSIKYNPVKRQPIVWIEPDDGVLVEVVD